MSHSSYQLVFILFTSPGLIITSHTNHNYNDEPKWLTQKRKYNDYKEDFQVKHALRMVDYIKNYQNVDTAKTVKDSIDQSAKSNRIHIPFTLLDHSKKKENHHTGHENNVILNEDKVFEKTDLIYAPEFWNQGTFLNVNNKFTIPAGRVKMHVFREPNTKYINVHGNYSYFAPWGYYVSQPVNPENNFDNVHNFSPTSHRGFFN